MRALTEVERNVLISAYLKGYRWIAPGEDGLCVYVEKPMRLFYDYFAREKAWSRIGGNIFEGVVLDEAAKILEVLGGKYYSAV